MAQFSFCISRKHLLNTNHQQPTTLNNMAPHRESNKLATNLNAVPSSRRPSRNMQGICNMSPHPTDYTVPQVDQQYTPVNNPLIISVLPATAQDQNPSQLIHHLLKDRLRALHYVLGKMIGLLTHQVSPFSWVLSLSAINYHL